MKNLIEYRIVIIFFLSILHNLHAQNPLDTIIISDKLLDNGIYFPARSCNVESDVSKGNLQGTIAYIDSIKIGNQIINKCNQKYYLILKDAKGRKILEGDFYDEFPDGHVITYFSNGNKKAEGEYKIQTYRREKIIYKGKGGKLSKSRFSSKIGEWKYYSKTGKLLETKVIKD